MKEINLYLDKDETYITLTALTYCMTQPDVPLTDKMTINRIIQKILKEANEDGSQRQD